MKHLTAVVSTLLVAACVAYPRFPSDFKFGAGTSAYQIEGAWNVSDKTPSVWDIFTHKNPKAILDESNADVACDSYHLWETDVAVAKQLGLQFYRFSISWPRLLPNAFSNYVSEDGARYYNNLINGLVQNGIDPVITLFHGDLLQRLQDLGGWTNPDIAIWFEDYARVAFTLFGDRVKTWVTVNEPLVFCNIAYDGGILSTEIENSGIENYTCAKNVMLAHARAFRLYDKDFRPQYKGKVGLTNNHVWFEPETPDDEENTELVRNLVALYAHPIYSKTGGWPPSVEQYIAEKSKMQGYPRSRLPVFTPDEIELVKGTFDYYGFNYYTSRVVQSKTKYNENAQYSWPTTGSPELGLAFVPDPNWKTGQTWLISYPKGIRSLMNWLTEQYGDIEIKILENGYSTSEPVINDTDRIEYLKDHLEQVLLAITEDGLNVTAYTTWSLLDNYEWIEGYTSRFGIVGVDFTDPLRTRTPRASAYYYARVIENHSLEFSEQ